VKTAQDLIDEGKRPKAVMLNLKESVAIIKGFRQPAQRQLRLLLMAVFGLGSSQQ
jgi:hypothetical protein